MGTGQSFPLPRYGCCIRPQNPNRCKENHSRMPKVKGDYRRNYSAAFSFTDPDNWTGSDQLNINAATEEEFMTLPGINRQTAQNIVEYRRQIDGFRKVEDLALVTGVGATRLNHIRLELCVGRRGLSKNSSASSSGIDISMHDNVSRGSAGGQTRTGCGGGGVTTINVNTSNVFQLMKVRFISQYLAENIVAYRDRKGSFSSFDDLLKVKGIKPEILSAIQPYLVLADEATEATATCAGDKRSSSVSHVERNVPDPSSKSQELLPRSEHPERKSLRSATAHVSTAANSLRVASWNLDSCSLEKMENPGVREVIAMTLLENRFGIVALQELTDPAALQKLVDEFDSPVVPNVNDWKGSRGNWKYVVSPAFVSARKVGHLAFLYDAEKNIELMETSCPLVKKSGSGDDHASSEAGLFLAEFKVGCMSLTIANVRLDSERDQQPNEKLLSAISSVLKDLRRAEGRRSLLLAGQFGFPPNNPAVASVFGAEKLEAALTSEQYTDVGPTNPNGSVCAQNIFLGRELLRTKLGSGEVIRNGLTSPWIPNGSWGWGGTVSTHCPIVTALDLDRSSRNGGSSDAGPSATFVVGSDS